LLARGLVLITHFGLANLLHYVDDFIYAALPSDIQQSFEAFQLVADFFGVPLKPSKLVPPCPVIEYVGFQVDAPNMSVGLPDDKRRRTRDLLAVWLGSPSTPRSYHEASSLLGYLMHIVQVLPDGKIFCDHLIRFVTSWRSPSFARHHVSPALLADLLWWHDVLGAWCGRRILPTSDWEDLGLFTDASGGRGAGGFLADRWWCL
jgi:hypothetical protein